MSSRGVLANLLTVLLPLQPADERRVQQDRQSERLRHGDGRLQHKHGSEETSRSSTVKTKASRRRRTAAELEKEKNDAVAWAFIEAQAKTEAAWDRFNKLAAATEPLDADFENYEPERNEDSTELHLAFLEWQMAEEAGKTDLAFEEWAAVSGEGEDEDSD